MHGVTKNDSALILRKSIAINMVAIEWVHNIVPKKLCAHVTLCAAFKPGLTFAKQWVLSLFIFIERAAEVTKKSFAADIGEFLVSYLLHTHNKSWKKYGFIPRLRTCFIATIQLVKCLKRSITYREHDSGIPTFLFRYFASETFVFSL